MLTEAALATEVLVDLILIHTFIQNIIKPGHIALE
jgi:hypothetical protein